MVINNYNLAVSLTCTVGVSVSVIGTDSVFFFQVLMKGICNAILMIRELIM